MEDQFELTSIVTEMAVELWRLDRRLDALERQTNTDVWRPVHESVSRMWALLAENGVEIREHVGERFVEGSALTVVHIKDLNGPLQVIETLRPSVLLGGMIVSHGQVVLGSQASRLDENS